MFLLIGIPTARYLFHSMMTILIAIRVLSVLNTTLLNDAF
jgi:hypothetical protein